MLSFDAQHASYFVYYSYLLAFPCTLFAIFFRFSDFWNFEFLGLYNELDSLVAYEVHLLDDSTVYSNKLLYSTWCSDWF
jgi:hypothetical protein